MIKNKFEEFTIEKAAQRAAKRVIKNESMRESAVKYVSKLTVTRFKRDNFTTVILTLGSTATMPNAILGVGVSKRSPNDFENDSIGYNLALVRAAEMVMTTNLFAH